MDAIRSQQKKHAPRGVTFVELLTVIAIISIVLGVPLVSMLSQRHNATLDEGQATVLQALATTRSRAVTGVGTVETLGHVACVRADEVEVFPEDVCADCSTCSGGDVYLLPPGITADEARIPFTRLSGISTALHSINVTGFGETRTVTVSEHGFIQ
jgi:prepilin-type N-terminal cleavage/methylation domain-containing protein